MASTYYRQIDLICGEDETRKDARELLNIARSKTGPGSGRDLGKNAIALPAICAFLASDRLGNNDVTQKMAQDVSCVRPKDFDAALSTVRSALSGYLTRNRGGQVSYQGLCRAHGLDEDALYWMEQVDKELRKNGEVDDLEVDDVTVIYMVFYWTCIALNIRSVKQATIISDYGVPLRDFQDLESILDSTCGELKDSMDKFVYEARSSRLATPARNKTPRRGSPLKEKAGSSLSPFPSPAKTPTKSMVSRDTPDTSPTKRKTVLPPLPFMTPTKKQRTASPIKLNRILPAGSNHSTPSKKDGAQGSSTATPTKVYGVARSFADSPTKPTPPQPVDEPPMPGLPFAASSVEKRRIAEPPSTPTKTRAANRSAMEQNTPSTPSPRKSVRVKASTADPSTPTRRSARPRFSRLGSDVGMEDTEDGIAREPSSESSEDEEDRPPPCRHYVPVFADRLFYHYRDPRVLREWEACDKGMEALRADTVSALAVH